MINQKLVYHIVIFEREYRNFVVPGDEVILVEFVHVWCEQHRLRPVTCTVQSDHLHLVVEQRAEQAIQKVISRLISELQKWSTLNQAVGEVQNLNPIGDSCHGKNDSNSIDSSSIDSCSKHLSAKCLKAKHPVTRRSAFSLDYALFTVSFPALAPLIRFVDSQSEHHATVSLEEELTSLLDKHDVEIASSRKPRFQLI